MGYKDNYKNMGRSNLTFLNASGDASHADILASIEKEKQDKIKAIPLVLSAQEKTTRLNAIIAEANAKIVAENARYEVEKAKRVDDLFGRIGNVLTATQTGLSTLGINRPVTENKGAPIGGSDSYTPPPPPAKNKTLLIIGGVVVALGIVGFVIYKRRN
jgi:hypothetical protein